MPVTPRRPVDHSGRCGLGAPQSRPGPRLRADASPPVVRRAIPLLDRPCRRGRLATARPGPSDQQAARPNVRQPTTAPTCPRASAALAHPQRSGPRRREAAIKHGAFRLGRVAPVQQAAASPTQRPAGPARRRTLHASPRPLWWLLGRATHGAEDCQAWVSDRSQDSIRGAQTVAATHASARPRPLTQRQRITGGEICTSGCDLAACGKDFCLYRTGSRVTRSGWGRRQGTEKKPAGADRSGRL